MTISIPRSLFVVALSGLLGLFMSLRTLSFYGVAPNFFLVLAIFFLYAPPNRRADAWFTFALALITFFGLSFVVFNFWTHYIVLLLPVVLIAYSLRAFLTGHALFDFLISIFAGTILFYVLSGVIFGGPLLKPIFLWEAFYNTLVGVIFWVIFRGSKFL